MSKIEVVSPESGFSVTKIADQLRGEIILGKFKIGDRIKISDISARYNTSAMPVREALRILNAERLVQIIPNKGAEVCPIDVDFVKDVYDVRGLIEAHLAEQACLKMNFDIFGQLEEIQNTIKLAARDESVSSLLSANQEFHQLISNLGGNKEAQHIINQHQNMITMLRNQVGFKPGRIEGIVEEHDQLIDALFRRDVSRAAAVARNHAASAYHDMMLCIQDYLK